MFTLIDTFRF